MVRAQTVKYTSQYVYKICIHFLYVEQTTTNIRLPKTLTKLQLKFAAWCLNTSLMIVKIRNNFTKFSQL